MHSTSGICMCNILPTAFNHYSVYLIIFSTPICNVLGLFYSRWNFIALQKSIHYSYTQSETLGTHIHVRPVWYQNTHSYRILPAGPLVAIFQHSLQFLQSESFQTHVWTIHRRAIGPLAYHNGASAYTSLTRHLPAPTIGCLHRPP
jgi:hypothetical protein